MSTLQGGQVGDGLCARLALSVPREVRRICEILRAQGHGAWVVGGCVRDLLLGRPVQDWDIATTALPQEVMSIFRKTIPTGIAHGTVSVLMGGRPHEVTTLRAEGEYLDGRRPKEVRFGVSLKEDLARRDLTINAIAFDPIQRELIDPFGGQEDLKRGLIRAVGNPMERFAEDGLRPLRACRLAAVLGFAMDAETEAAIRPNLSVLAKVAIERVVEEWRKLLRAERPSLGLKIMRRTGILGLHAPWLEAIDEERFRFLLGWVDRLERDVCLRLSALGHGLEGSALGAWMKKMRFSNEERENTLAILRAAQEIPEESALPSVRRWLGRNGIKAAKKAIALKKGAQSDQESLFHLCALEEAIQSVVERKEPLSIKALAIGGEALSPLVGGPGPKVGRLLEALLNEVLEDPSLNTEEKLLERAKVLAKELK
ncbi:MAG: CCA tRNA nucleotidyltransferase [Sandaracinaceae bacterium]|nr:CCA tRNA nucleotidyltransferase [Sandaracinaceae bacterium]